MDEIYTTRVERLRGIIRDEFGGKQASIAAQLGRQPDYISRLLSGRTKLAENLAREFEELLKKPPFWLDGLADAGAWPLPGIDPADFARIPPEDREEVIGLIRLKIARFAKKSAAA